MELEGYDEFRMILSQHGNAALLSAEDDKSFFALASEHGNKGT